LFLFAPIKWAIKILGLLITAVVVYLLVTGVQVVLAENSIGIGSSSTQKVDAIIVLVPEQSVSVPTPDLVARLQETLLLLQNRVASHVILVSTQKTGLTSSIHSSRSPSFNAGLVSARTWLIAHGIPNSDVVGTFNGATYDALHSAARSISSANQVAIVTDAIDRLWVSHTAKAVGLNVGNVYAAIGSQGLFTSELDALWIQDSGVATGRIIGFSHTNWLTG